MYHFLMHVHNKYLRKSAILEAAPWNKYSARACTALWVNALALTAEGGSWEGGCSGAIHNFFVD